MKTKQGRNKISAAVDEANKVSVVWKQNPKFSVGNTVSQKEFQQAIQDLLDADAELTAKQHQHIAMRNLRSDKLRTLRGLITRARSGFRSQFGPDSTEYQLSGCKRASDRKKPSRKNGNGNGNGNENGQPSHS